MYSPSHTDLSADDVDFEETHDDHNMMNNALLQVYRENCAVPAPTIKDEVFANAPTTPASGSDNSFQDGPDSAVVTPCQNSQGDVCTHDARGDHFDPVYYRKTGVPVETSVESTFLSHVTDSDSHVTITATSGGGQVTGSDGQCSTEEQISVSVCGGEGGVREEGKEEERVGATYEERRRPRKVTFAPDVIDKQDSTVVCY